MTTVKNRYTEVVIGEFEIKPLANLREANLSGADLSGANLRGANLGGAVIAESQIKTLIKGIAVKVIKDEN